MNSNTDSKLALIKSQEDICEVGILALQGDFELHTQSIARLGHESRLVKTAEQLKRVKRLIIPGGESTTMNKLIDMYGLRADLTEFARNNPVWGTCAGLIMLSTEANDPRVQPLGVIDIESCRNAYGRQINSFSKSGQVNLGQGWIDFEMVFIRAPKILSLGKKVAVLGKLGEEAVMVRQDNVLVTAFHPELTEDAAIHEYFIKM